MKFVVDAHLPRRLCAVLGNCGHDAIHTLDLPDRNRSKDAVINRVSFDELRVVISKDTDFFYSHLLHGRPWKLLLVRTGNISAKDLCDLLSRNLNTIVDALQRYTLVEVDRKAVRPVV